jgi:glyoxylase-like metal-dependent hydrolase (beta-lactamase superfamily II)
MSAELAFNRSADVDYGEVRQMGPGIRRVVANNPGPYTFLGTNTYIVGEGAVAVIDPGPPDADHLDAIAAALKGERLTHILVTHSHRDHCDGARALQARLGGELLAYGPTESRRGAGTPGLGDRFVDADFQPDHILRGGDVVRGRFWSLDVLHTPGHAPDHLCFALVGQRTVFTGDHVMGWNTTVIAPPEGNLADFLASLELLVLRRDKMFLPGHGGRVQTPQRVVRAYIMHRQWREQTICARLDEGLQTIPEITSKVYGELDADLEAAARLSVYAHLQYLMTRGLVRVDEPPSLTSRFRLNRPAAS